MATTTDNGSNIPTCPFCPFSDADGDFVAQHVDFCHPEGGTSSAADPFAISDVIAEERTLKDYSTSGRSGEDDDGSAKYVECPDGCGEVVGLSELPTHLDLHVAEGMALEDVGTDSHDPPHTATHGTHHSDEIPDHPEAMSSSKAMSGDAFLSKKERSWIAPRKTGRKRSTSNAVETHGGNMNRLGRSELGPHAYEKRMPSWLMKLLEKGSKPTRTNRIAANGTIIQHESVENAVADVIPTLVRLCRTSCSVKRAFFCSAKVHQIFKMQHEGGFCGYRNIQMLISYMLASKVHGHQNFGQTIPSILQLQEMIENAWDMGFNPNGKIETGGIRGTRKFIGTSEAQALFQSLEIPCEAHCVSETKELRALDALYMIVADYFRAACNLEDDQKVFETSLPPMYLQHHGHSLTIIGFEIHDDNTANLLVFDPMFKTPPAIRKLIGTNTIPSDPGLLLKAYRRGSAYFHKYKEFELLQYAPPLLGIRSRPH